MDDEKKSKRVCAAEQAVLRRSQFLQPQPTEDPKRKERSCSTFDCRVNRNGNGGRSEHKFSTPTPLATRYDDAAPQKKLTRVRTTAAQTCSERTNHPTNQQTNERTTAQGSFAPSPRHNCRMRAADVETTGEPLPPYRGAIRAVRSAPVWSEREHNSSAST